MKCLLLSILVTQILSQVVDFAEKDNAEWELFMIEHERTYDNKAEESKRFAIFKDNMKKVREHNKKYEEGKVNFTVAINQFSDMTQEEVAARMNGYRNSEGHPKTEQVFIEPEYHELPDHVDWRRKGAVTKVKNQGLCGSCWAFSATGSLEGQHFLKTNRLVSLSEQNLLDCILGPRGCPIGYTANGAFDYINHQGGIDTERSYPYEHEGGRCRYSARHRGATVSGYVDLPSGDETALKIAVATIGPISVSIDADHSNFIHFHGKGVFDEPDCSTTRLTHAVLVVGYGTTRTGVDYWLVKNSYGTKWGHHGYILMKRNANNQCGIASSASYPLL